MSTGMYYMRLRAFEFLAQVQPRDQLATFVAHAIAATEMVSVSIVKEPLFYLHTAEDLRIWQRSSMRTFLTIAE